MNDKNQNAPSAHNLKGLVQDLVEQLDARMAELRSDSTYRTMRPSDAKTFMLIARHARSISDLARAMHITRQAAHASVARLVGLGLVTPGDEEPGRKARFPQITPAGEVTRAHAAKAIKRIEDEAARKIGLPRLNALRQAIVDLLAD